MDEGGEQIENTVLFGKYQLVRLLGKGRSGTVYLALHLELKEYRAVKRVPKASVGYEEFKKEALLLSSLDHAGIPKVYDLEEDESYSYLIEEYLEGESLYALVKSQGHLNQEAVLRIGVQVCDLVHYLHSAGETPVLYLDLQPGNLLFCHGCVKLLDFDHADRLDEANRSRLRYGTPGFCAPEQKAGGALGVYTDVYQIGALLYYLSTGYTREEADGKLFGQTLGRIIGNCVKEDRAQRYPSIEELKEELEILYSQTGVFKENQPSSLIVALAGSRHGAGVTHIALGFVRYLNQLGVKTIYEEWNDSQDVRDMAVRTRSPVDSYGICQIRQVAVKPFYGPAVRLKQAFYPVVVRDYGTEWKTVREAPDVTCVWLVHGGKLWEQEAGVKALEALKNCPGFLVLYNRTIGSMRPDRPRDVSAEQCFQVPDFPDPWECKREAESFFKELAGRIPLPGAEHRGRRMPGWAEKTAAFARARLQGGHG